MEHNFNIFIAKKYGIQSAILLNHIYFWLEKNRANEINFFDGYYWTYNSKRAFADLFPYLTARQIDYAIQKLVDDGVIITGIYNKSAHDRTLWYTITKKGYSILQNCEMEFTNLGNGSHKNVQPIPNTIPYINTNSESSIIKEKENNTSVLKEKKKIPPTLEEVQTYCGYMGYNINPEGFYDYYTSNGWKVGKNPMKDWQAAVRQWARNQKGGGQSFLDDAKKLYDKYKAEEAEENGEEIVYYENQ